MAEFRNQAVLEYNGKTVNSNVVVGEIKSTLDVEKTALTTSYKRGDKITYVALVRNNDDEDMNNVTLSDNLGAFPFGTETLTPLNFVDTSLKVIVDGEIATGYSVDSTDPLEISAIQIPAGSSATVVYEAIVNEYATVDDTGEITNEVVVSNGNLPATDSDTMTIYADTSPNLNIVKALSPTEVMQDGSLTYTFTIRNYGDAVTEADNLKFRDMFNPRLNNLAVSVDGVPVPEDQYGYDETGEFYINEGYLTVPQATSTRNADTGVVEIQPGEIVLTIEGDI